MALSPKNSNQGCDPHKPTRYFSAGEHMPSFVTPVRRDFFNS
jgi:hypothetical protein